MILTYIYPFLFSLFPTLSLYIANIMEVYFGDIIFPTAIVLSLTALIYIGSVLSLRNIRKSALVTFIFIFFIFSFGSFTSLFINKNMTFEQVAFYYPRIFSTWLLLFPLSLVMVLLNEKYINFANKFLSFFSLILILTSILRIVLIKSWESSSVKNIPEETLDVLPKQDNLINNELPDVYYIIMDRYLGNTVLEKKFNFDNSSFLNILREKGFYVANESRSNYLKTAHSLASSLNMGYINYLSEEVGENSDNWLPLYSLIEDNKVTRILKESGYKFIHVGSWWEPTRENDLADISFNTQSLSEFSENLFNTTVFYPIRNQVFSREIQKEQMERTLNEIDFIKKIPFDKDTTYTFAHFLITHPPYVFDEEGNLLDPRASSVKTEKEIYLAQIKYANILIEDLVGEIFSNSEKAPVIVIQSDEGKYPIDNTQYDHKYDWFKAPPDDIEEKLSILNAIYVPGVDKSIFYPTITPVNTFRIIFNQIFNSKMEILKDDVFLHQNNFNIYKFKKLE